MSTRALGLGVVLLGVGCAGSRSPGDDEEDAGVDAPVDCDALRVELRAELDGCMRHAMTRSAMPECMLLS